MLIGRYDPSLVLVSVLVAVFASYAALSVAGRVKQAHGYASWAWTAGGALAMGGGIWAMHFIGMLAFHLPIPLGYDLPLTVLSLLLPILVCGMALWQLRAPVLAPRHLASSALLMGVGINAMHYTGMAAMRMFPSIQYDPLLFALSVLIAVAASAGALWIAFRLRQGASGAWLVQLAAALVMGFAVAGMHYTGMAAARFPAGSICLAAEGWINPRNLALIVTVVIVGILLVALLVSVYDARLQARAASLDASLAIAEERKTLYLHEVEARIEAERLNQLKDEFLSTVSHELRTPLNAILGWSQLLGKGPVGGDMLRRGLETIERNARAQAQLVDDLLDMSRILSGKVRLDLQPVRPAEFVGTVVESLGPTALAKRIRLDAELDQEAGPVLADSVRMQQVMWNLVSNAIKFTPAGGAVEVSLWREGEQVAMRVRDTGAGIRADFLPYVFDRFRQGDTSTTRQHGGLGLGLSIVRQLVELHGGTVGVDSAGEGQGATFTVRLPLQPALPDWAQAPDAAPGEAQAAGAQAPLPDLSGTVILALDDDADSLDVVRTVLQGAGAEVIAAASPLDALRLLQERRPQLLVSDIGMPDMDGFELIRRVRALADNQLCMVPALALSAFARKEDRERAFACGFTDYIVKPVTPALLVEAVAALLDAGARSAAALDATRP
ncbi:MHYT domain-containing protein [Massilia sp.]|uniref:MHYT domain-containing protein n=1 Tax=Massilia sp. TaxID=1882437 RepID=UPI0028AC2C89|nr:MHYT domain-containing protein [Massilia sp.]